MQPLPSEEQNWRRLLLSEGFDGFEDGRLAIVAACTARFHKAAIILQVVMKEENILGPHSEADFGRFVMQRCWPGAFGPPPEDKGIAELEAEIAPGSGESSVSSTPPFTENKGQTTIQLPKHQNVRANIQNRFTKDLNTVEDEPAVFASAGEEAAGEEAAGDCGAILVLTSTTFFEYWVLYLH